MESYQLNVNGTLVTVETPDGFAAMLEEAFTEKFGYSETVDDGEGNEIPNPQTKAQFVGVKLVDYARAVVAAHNRKKAVAQTNAAVTQQNEQFGTQINVS